MSVDYTTCVGFGYMIQPEEYEQMREFAEDHGNWDEIVDEFCYVNAYTNDSPRFLGEIFTDVEPGEYIAMDMVLYPSTFNPELFSRRYAEILTLCGIDIAPESKWETPKLYMMHRVW